MHKVTAKSGLQYVNFVGNVIGEMWNAYKILVRKPEWKRTCISRHRWENIRMDLKEIWWKVVDRIHLTQDRDQRWALVITVMNLQVP